jgi:hypothetical protein
MCYTGRLFEFDFCGKVVDCHKGGAEYQPWYSSMNLIRNRFSREVDKNPAHWDISDPDGLCSNLFYYVATALQVNNMEELKVFPAFGSAFDIYHGIDLFFEYRGKFCTIDLSCNPNKDSYKADVMICPEDELEEIAAEIANVLLNN